MIASSVALRSDTSMVGKKPYFTAVDNFFNETALGVLLAALRANLAGYDENPFVLDRYSEFVTEALLGAIPRQCTHMARPGDGLGTLRYRLQLRQFASTDEQVLIVRESNTNRPAPCFAVFLYGGPIAFSGGAMLLASLATPSDKRAFVRPRCNRAVFTRTDVSIALTPIALAEGSEQDLFVLSGILDHDT